MLLFLSRLDFNRLHSLQHLVWLIIFYSSVCVKFDHYFILRSTSFIDITGVTGAEEILSVGETSYTIHNGSVIVSPDLDSVSSSSSGEESDFNMEFTADR